MNAGLSPRVRGNPLQPTQRGLPFGSIPARAGEPVFHRLRGGFLGVYPRACGGTRLPSLARRLLGGLSPRVRGNPSSIACAAASWGSIPARAGEPLAFGGLPARSRVYPRACGGTRGRGGEAPALSGLSPRVRGNRIHLVRLNEPVRSIPARAGEPPRRHPVVAPAGSIPARAGEPRKRRRTAYP